MKVIAAERWRLVAVAAAMAGGLLFLGASLWSVQVVSGAELARAQDEYSLRRLRLPSVRGRIVDRKGEVLAENRPSYCVAVYVEELRKRGAWSNTVNAISGRIDELAGIVGRAPEVSARDVEMHLARRRAMPLLAWRGLDDRALARFAEHPSGLAGADIYVQPERVYPLGDCAAHIVGYVGAYNPGADTARSDAEAWDEEEEGEDGFDLYLPDLVGKQGIEQRYDVRLAGRPGGELVRVDVSGYKRESEDCRPPEPGRDVVLALDSRLQQVAEEALFELRGAVVVMDCRSGDVLVMANAPRFNPSDFSPSISAAAWRKIQEDAGHPMLDRSLRGIYPPGSIFKPVVALSALEREAITPETVYHCTGAFNLGGGRRLRCWHAPGHGDVSLVSAIAQSCNPYFCDIGTRMGFEPHIRADADRLGLGKRPDTELSASAGTLPSDAWKRATMKEGWRGGDNANIAIGQGLLTVTPVQMAVVACAIANGGTVLRPRLVLSPEENRQRVVATMGWSETSVRALHQGMYAAVQGENGTAKHAAIKGMALGGKTGTAEYTEKGERKKHAWTMVFAPFENPEVAIVVVVEDSTSGGRAAAPIAHRVLSAYFNTPPKPDIYPVPAGEPLPDAMQPLPDDEPIEEEEE
ncbi:MAG: penicillin-binding protein 2 [Kiritimatiellaeota bacterium]|nr:penicillin-binding protein 2 [Kiritimatiellota bacterium]